MDMFEKFFNLFDKKKNQDDNGGNNEPSRMQAYFEEVKKQTGSLKDKVAKNSIFKVNKKEQAPKQAQTPTSIPTQAPTPTQVPTPIPIQALETANMNIKPQRPIYTRPWFWILGVVVLIFLLGSISQGNYNRQQREKEEQAEALIGDKLLVPDTFLKTQEQVEAEFENIGLKAKFVVANFDHKAKDERPIYEGMCDELSDGCGGTYIGYDELGFGSDIDKGYYANKGDTIIVGYSDHDFGVANIPTATPTATPTSTPTLVPEMTVHFLDVGQGLSVLVRSHEKTLIYDGGGRDKSSRVVSYLQKQYIEDIDYLVSSHYDEDHVSGLIGCLNAFNVHNIIGSDYEHDSDIYQSFMDKVEEKGLEVQHPVIGDTFEFGSVKMTILSASADGNDSNSNSIVIKLENGENSVILTGDADAKAEEVIVNSGLDLKTDILSVSHHGSATSTSNLFLEKVVPEWAVISAEKDNQYGHPDKDTMDKLEAMGIEVYRNDLQEDIVATSDGSVWRWDKEPCNDYSAGNAEDEGTQPQPTQEAAAPVEAEVPPVETSSEMVWQSATGSKYHSIPDCGRMNPNKATEITIESAEAKGLGRCSKCF